LYKYDILRPIQQRVQFSTIQHPTQIYLTATVTLLFVRIWLFIYDVIREQRRLR